MTTRAASVFTNVWWAAAASAALAVVAMVLYPGGTPLDHSTTGYRFFQNFLSDLGMTVAYGGGANLIGSVLFVASIAILVTAYGTCVVHFIRLYSRSKRARPFALAAGLAGAVVCASFVGVALTPENRVMDLHVRLTFLAFRVFPLAALLLTIASARDEQTTRETVVGWAVLTIALGAYAAMLQWGPDVRTETGLRAQVTAQKLIVIAALTLIGFQARELSTAHEPGEDRPLPAARSASL